MTRLVLPTPPTSNHYWKPRAIWQKFPGKWIGTIYKTAEAKKYCAAVQLIAQQASLACHPKGVDVVFHLIWYRGNMRGDLANREKCVEDALQGVLYANDRQNKAKHTKWMLDRANPRVEVWVTRYEEEAA